jgi:hypothetical protein
MFIALEIIKGPFTRRVGRRALVLSGGQARMTSTGSHRKSPNCRNPTRAPVALGLFRKLVRSRDDRDGVEERGLNQDGGLAHLGSATGHLGWMGMDLSIF